MQSLGNSPFSQLNSPNRFHSCCIFMTRPTKLEGHYVFALSVRHPSVRKVKKNGLKHVLGGFEYVLGVFRDFDFCLSARPSGQWMGYVLCRELVLGF